MVLRGSHTWIAQPIKLKTVSFWAILYLSELDFQVRPTVRRKHTAEILLRPHFYPAMCKFHLSPVLTGSVMADTDLQLGRI